MTALDRPNALGIGFAKAGTSYMAKLLADHSNVRFPEPDGQYRKATYFFCEPDADEEGLRRYMATNFSTLDHASHKVAMEWCVSYVGNETALCNIGNLLGDDVRLLLAYRDPREAFLSMYKYSMTTNPDDPAANKPPEYMLENHYEEYVEEFFYDRQLEQLRDILPRAHLLLLDFNRLTKDPTSVFERVCQFLEIPPVDVQKSEEVNASHAYRSVFLDKCLRKGLTVAFGERRATRYYRGPRRTRPGLVRLFQKLNGRKITLSDNVRSELDRIHAPHIERFRQLIANETVI